MATITTENTTYQMFNDSGANTIEFGRAINILIITVDASTTISFDSGDTFMTLTAGTYNWDVGLIKTLVFGAGTYSGVGISV